MLTARADGEGYALTVSEPHRAIPALLDELESLDRPLARLTTRHVSLEDVFVSLTGRHLRDDSAEETRGFNLGGRRRRNRLAHRREQPATTISSPATLLPSLPPRERVMLRNSPFFQLYRARLREFWRQPARIFWVYGFPTVLASVLGFAFQSRPPAPIQVDLVEGPFSAHIEEAIRNHNDRLARRSISRRPRAPSCRRSPSSSPARTRPTSG